VSVKKSLGIAVSQLMPFEEASRFVKMASGVKLELVRRDFLRDSGNTTNFRWSCLQIDLQPKGIPSPLLGIDK
jgi:hypothetical protein